VTVKQMTLHQRLVGAILDESPGAKTKGFFRHLRFLLDDEDIDEKWNDGIDISVVPDAYVIDRELNAVVIYEVEITNPLSPEKMARYRKIASLLNLAGWTAVLLRVDALGRTTTEDLFLSWASASRNVTAAGLLDVIDAAFEAKGAYQ
jgi:hypothetical protein